MFKIQNSFYYVNCDKFQKQLYKQYGFSPVDKLLTESEPAETFNWKRVINKNFEINSDTSKSVDEPPAIRKDPDIIIDVSAVNYFDTNAAKTLLQTIEDFKKVHVFVYICGSQGLFVYLVVFKNF